MQAPRPTPGAKSTPPIAGPRLLRYREVAERWGWHPVSVARLCSQGRGPRVTHIGRSVRIAEDALLEWERSQQRSSTLPRAERPQAGVAA